MRFKAYIIQDAATGHYCIFSPSGGPIISSPTIEGAKKKFEEGLQLSVAISKLEHFMQSGDFPIKKIEEIEYEVHME